MDSSDVTPDWIELTLEESVLGHKEQFPAELSTATVNDVSIDKWGH